MVVLIGVGEKHWNQLVAALADLTSHLLEGHAMAEVFQRFLPCHCVEVDGIDQGAIDIEDCGFGHEQSFKGRWERRRGPKGCQDQDGLAKSERLQRENAALLKT
jgi:hypothetical protein